MFSILKKRKKKDTCPKCGEQLKYISDGQAVLCKNCGSWLVGKAAKLAKKQIKQYAECCKQKNSNK